MNKSQDNVKIVDHYGLHFGVGFEKGSHTSHEPVNTKLSNKHVKFWQKPGGKFKIRVCRLCLCLSVSLSLPLSLSLSLSTWCHFSLSSVPRRLFLSLDSYLKNYCSEWTFMFGIKNRVLCVCHLPHGTVSSVWPLLKTLWFTHQSVRAVGGTNILLVSYGIMYYSVQ